MLEKKQVWVDTDLSVGMQREHRPGYCDVDDGFALLQLFKADNIEVCGISAVFGNTTIDNAFELGQYMSEQFTQTKIPVYKGAAEALTLQNVHTNEAVEALAAALKEQPLTIMAIGPATNIGILLLKYPELSTQIKEVVLVAGRRKHTDYFKIGNKGNHARDLNFDLDNDAFRILFEAAVPVVLCPFEISSKVWVGQNDLDALVTSGEKGNLWLGKASQTWLNQWLEQGASGFNPFDVLASHYIIAPQHITSEVLNARLEIHIDDTVQGDNNTSYKSYLLCDEKPGFKVTYCYNVTRDYHKQLLQSLLNPLE